MKNLIVLLAFFAPLALTAQNTITWKGGTPGKETAWNEARNWDMNRVPSEDDVVVIQVENNGHFSQPIISSEVQVAWVKINVGASLTIAGSGQLTVDGEYTYSEGISIYGGDLTAKGKVVLKDIEMEFVADIAHLMEQKPECFSAVYGPELSVVNSK